MPDPTSYPLKDLETKGFLNAENFFDAEDLEVLRAAFDSKPNLAHGLYPEGTVRPAPVPQRVREKVEKLIVAINAKTGVRVDPVCPENTTYLRSRHFYDWHQDHESYYLQNDHVSHWAEPLSVQASTRDAL